MATGIVSIGDNEGFMALHKGDVIELVANVKTDGLLSSTVRAGTRGVIVGEPGLLSTAYRVRLDPDGKEANVSESSIKKVGGRWLF